MDPQTQHPPFRLTVSRKDAARELQAAVKIGQAIRSQRIRDMRDLDEARREKQEWVQRSMELLSRLVTTEDWTEQFNDFVPTILPEYAEFGMFVDVFEEEMRHRLGRLHAFGKSLATISEPPPLQPQPEDRPAHPELAEVLDRVLEAQPDAAFVDDEDGAADTDDEDAPSDSCDDEEDQTDANSAQSPSQQIETIFAPPEASNMPQQQQQQQLQQQQSVAASLLHEPSEASPTRPGSSSPSSLTRGALIVRTNDESAAQATAQFMEKLGLALRVIDRRTPNGHSMLDELNSQSGARFILMLVDPHNPANTAPDDLFDLGCCVGRMGAERVFALHRGGESATDRFGIAHVPIDDSEGWQLQLARLLRKAGVSIDLNKLV